MARARADLAGLNLTSTQKDQIKAINKKYADQFTQLREARAKNGSGQSPVDRSQMQTLMQREREDIRSVLTPAQRTQFDANVAKHKAGRGRGNGPPKGEK